MVINLLLPPVQIISNFLLPEHNTVWMSLFKDLHVICPCFYSEPLSTMLQFIDWLAENCSITFNWNYQ